MRIFKAVREKVFIYKGYSVKLSAEFPVGTLQARRQWDDIFKVLKVKKKRNANLEPKLSFRNKRKKRPFLDKQS